MKKNKISEFATYDNPYNHYFVDVLEFNFPNEFKIHRVPSIQEGRKKASLFVLPGTSSKSMHMESVGYAIKNGDFELDNDLNRLLETKDIQNLAVSKFRTMGNSFFWVYESEITSYRKLMLKEFDNTHYFRSFAWVLKF
ncbi:MAG: hypothetical protein NXH75_00435 [Halobacteriovoraceae bacterium]|nr:hypothetical protein [Halobacteriovoraceae bacterium]